MLRREGFLMLESAEDGEEIRPCISCKDQIEEAMSSMGVTNRRRRAQETEASGRICCGRTKSINRVITANK